MYIKKWCKQRFSNYIDSTTVGNLAVGLGELFLSAGIMSILDHLSCYYGVCCRRYYCNSSDYLIF